MLSKRRFLGRAVFGLVAIAVLSGLVMLLWNAIMARMRPSEVPHNGVVTAAAFCCSATGVCADASAEVKVAISRANNTRIG